MEHILESLALYGYIILALYSFGGGMVALAGAGILSVWERWHNPIDSRGISIQFIGDNLLVWVGPRPHFKRGF